MSNDVKRILVCVCGHDRMGYTLQDGVLCRWYVDEPNPQTLRWHIHTKCMEHHRGVLQEVAVHTMWDGKRYTLNYAMFYLMAHKATLSDGQHVLWLPPHTWRVEQTDIKQLPLNLKGV